jgi:predicted glycosyltransferase
MRVLFDVVHPQHALFYAALARRLVKDGHKVTIASREKDVTIPLLDGFSTEHICISKKQGSGFISDFIETIIRVFRIQKLIKKFRPSVVLTSNPTGSLAAWITRTPCIFDTMDGPAHGLHYSLPARLSTIITSPQLLGMKSDQRHITYPAVKSMFYVTQDADATKKLCDELGIHDSETVAVLRVSAYTASHDRGAVGLSNDQIGSLIEFLGQRFDHLAVSAESQTHVDGNLSTWLKKHPGSFHRLLERADLLVGDSVTVAEEAAVLATPSVWVSEFALDRPIAIELEREYQLTKNVLAVDAAQILRDVERAVDELLSPDGKANFCKGHERLVQHSGDPIEWYIRVLEKLFDRTQASL